MQAAEPWPVLRSPDGQVEVSVALGEWCSGSRKWPGTPLWQVSLAGRPMLRTSRLGLMLGDTPLAGNLVLAGVARHRIRRAWQPGYGDAITLLDHANEMVVRLHEEASPARHFDFVFRCYDRGVAVRARLPRQRGLWRAAAPALDAVFCFPDGTRGWLETSEGFRPAPLDELPESPAQPLVLDNAHGRLACLCAAGKCHSHTSEGMRMVPTPWESPWQVLLLADRPCGLPEGGGVLLNLGARPAAFTMTDDAGRNCTLPFACHRLWQVADAGDGSRGRSPSIAEQPESRKPGTPATPAHRLAYAVVCGTGETVWNETRFLRGEIGEFVVVARRHGDTWQVGAITGADGRVLTVRLEDFVGENGTYGTNRTYVLEIRRDPLPGEPAGADGVVTESFEGVEAFDLPRLELPPGGGFTLRLTPSP